jgi:hypothetical protein
MGRDRFDTVHANYIMLSITFERGDFCRLKRTTIPIRIKRRRQTGQKAKGRTSSRGLFSSMQISLL